MTADSAPLPPAPGEEPANTSPAPASTRFTWSGPAELVALRHGQSEANAALLQGKAVSDVAGRDADVALSKRGVQEARAAGRRLAGRQEVFDAVYCSPYLRTRRTCDIIVAQMRSAGHTPPPVLPDERLRDRELGVLELMGRHVGQKRALEEAGRREAVGEFYYRPPGGESFPDVAERVRSFLADAQRAESGRRVLVVAHDAVVLMLRYTTEPMTEEDFAALNGAVPTGSISRWAPHGGALRLVSYGEAEHLGG